MALVYGFGGMRDGNSHLSFRPRLPRRMNRLCFKVRMNGSLLVVDIRRENVSYRLESGPGVTIVHNDEALDLEVGSPVRRPL